MYVIDRLAHESSETLLDIKPGSYGINKEGDIWYESNSQRKMVKSVSRGTAQADIPLMSSDCSQAGGDAFSVNTVRTRSGYTAVDSSDENKSESEEREKRKEKREKRKEKREKRKEKREKKKEKRKKRKGKREKRKEKREKRKEKRERR